MYANSFTWPEESAQPHLSSEQQGLFAPVLWDQHQSLDPIAEWVDIEDMIPPAEESCGNERFSHFSGALWTQ
jgi:hypothetical protein